VRVADDKSTIRPQDTERINVNEGYELEYWCDKFVCTASQLQAAVKKSGSWPKTWKPNCGVGNGGPFMDIVLIVLIGLLLAGGGGGFYYGGAAAGGSIGGLVLLLLILWVIFGSRRSI
jgi:uncharacterized protein DUF3606